MGNRKSVRDLRGDFLKGGKVNGKKGFDIKDMFKGKV
jgi:hypothetical protein